MEVDTKVDKPTEEKKSKEDEIKDYIVQMQQEASQLPLDQIKQRIRAVEAQTMSLKGDANKMKVDIKKYNAIAKENKEKLKISTGLPHLFASISELIELDPIEEKDVGSGVKYSQKELQKRKCAIIKTALKTNIFVPNLGLMEDGELNPLDIVGVNKDTFLIYEKLPPEYDQRVKVMELDEKPKEQYTDVGGLDKQIQEIEEAVVLPIEKKDLFEAIGIKPPKGILMYGPPGTGKTMLARAVAARSKATFLKLAGSQLVQSYIGEGAKIVRDCFRLAKEKEPTIIFIDEIDAIGLKRTGADGHSSGEVQRTLLEILNQLDGFTSNENVKVIAATNRPDVLDPALLRSGRLDRKVEFPMPNEESRSKILQIHSRKMNYDPNQVKFKELAKSTDDFNGAMLKAVAVEAGMLALRRGGTEVTHEDFVEGINQVKAKKKAKLYYYS